MVYLPEWLPDSIHHKTVHDSLLVEYVIKAYFQKDAGEDFPFRKASEKEEFPFCRGSRKVYVYRPQTEL